MLISWLHQFPLLVLVHFLPRSRETLHLPVCTAKLFPTASTISSNSAQTVCYSRVANQFLIPSHMSSDSSCKGILSREAARVKEILYYLSGATETS